MVGGIDLFFALFNNLAIFIALVAIYSYLLVQFELAKWYRRQIILGLSFGIFAIGCMYARIPVFEGVIVDQRNAIIVLSGAFGGPLSAVLSAALAGGFRIYLGGDGVVAGVIGVSLAAIAGIGLHIFPGRFDTMRKTAVSAFVASLIILPGFLFVGDIQTGWALMKAMAIPYGSAIFLGIFLGGLFLHREEDRRQAELLFREREEQYREIVEGTSDLITHTDKHGNFSFVNHMAEETLGLSPEECIGLSALEFIHPDDKEITIDWFTKCVAQKTTQSQIENRQVNLKTGKLHTVLWSSAFYYDDTGNFVGVGSIARDRTKTREAESNFKNLFEKMPDGYAIHVIIRDHDGKPIDYRFISINPALERITGWMANDFIGKTISEALPQTKKYWFEIYREIAESGKPATFESYYEALDKYFEITVYSPANNQFATIFQDITLRTKAEKAQNDYETQLRHSQKMEAIGRLAGGIAHDFNNILVPIMGYAELGMMKLSSEDTLYTNLKRIREAAERAADLTQQILSFSRKQVVEIKVLDLNEITDDFQKMIQRLIGEDIELQLFLTPGLHHIKANKGQIEQVLLNLVVNARDAMPMGGKLTIETANAYLDEAYVQKYAMSLEPGNYAMLIVSDTGQGMDAETRQQIFEPFFTTKEQGKGTGLGLATVFGIVKQNNGYIWVYSELGQGATFKIYLPQAEGTTQTSELIDENPESLKGTETVLVIEDDEMVRKLVCETLSAHGYEVIEAQSGAEGIQYAFSYDGFLHLLLTDVIMPEMNGRQVYEKVVAIHKNIKVLYMSGYTDNVIDHHIMLDEKLNFLQKPFTVQQLTKKVRQVLNQNGV